MNKNELERRKNIYELEKKSLVIGPAMSLIIPGAGSMYAGKVGKGIFLFLLTSFLVWILIGFILWIITAFIAYDDVYRYNKLKRLELQIEE